jgi:hypothetical protein
VLNRKFSIYNSRTNHSRDVGIHCGTHSNSKRMNKLITSKNLTIINFVIVSYFILIWLISFYKIDFVLIGVFGELLTIPFLIAQIVFLVIGIKFLIKNQKKFLTIVSVLSLAICTIITIKSFF